MSTMLMKFLRALLVLVVVFELAGCGGGSGSSGSSIAAPSALSYPSPQIYTVGTAIATLSATVTGTVTSYSVSPVLPTGLVLNAITGQITGTPTTAMAAATYTVTASNSGGISTFALSISVSNAAVAAPSALSYPSPQIYTVGTAITALSATVTGTVTSYSVSPVLPAGLVLNAITGQITGTPTAAMATATYTVTASNSGGITTFALSISVNPSQPAAAVFPSTTILAGQEIAYCYYFHFSSTSDVMLKSWQSSFSAGVFSLDVYSTDTDVQPVGTVSASQCGYSGASAGNLPALIYSSRTAQDGWSLPSNDGTGKPLGKLIKAGQPMFLRVHAINTSNASIQVEAQVSVTGYPPGTVTTQADSFTTYNGNITIPPNAIAYTQTQTCTLPPAMQFTRLSIFTHKQGIHSYVRDGLGVNGTIVVDSPDWTRPSTVVWNSSPFGIFTTGAFTYRCDYTNNSSRPIRTGDSVQTDEICKAFGYYFPATKPTLCHNGSMIP